jgi:hypothetical protein
VDVTRVQHVILSHFHYDHVGNYALFPNATFYVQDAEMAFYTGATPRRRVPAVGGGGGHLRADPPDLRSPRPRVRGRRPWRWCRACGCRRWADTPPQCQIRHRGACQGAAVVASDASHYLPNFEDASRSTTLHDTAGLVPRAPSTRSAC